MTSALCFLFFAGLAALAVLCAYQPRVGSFLAVAGFGTLGVHEAAHGSVEGPIHCIGYATILVLLARTSLPAATPPAKPRVKG